MRRLTWIILLEGKLVEEGWRKGEGILINMSEHAHRKYRITTKT